MPIMPLDVVLNVYDLINQTPLCCGFFHTGVEILGVEYSFGQGGGCYEIPPKSAEDGRFRESIVLGTIESSRDATRALDSVRGDFQGDCYNVIFKNCNDFSTAFVQAMLGRNAVPGYINRLARMGRMWPVRCFIPPHLKGNAGSTTAPLLPTQPQLQLFQGSGQSLSGSTTSQSSTSGTTRGGMSAFGSRCRNMFSRRGAAATRDTSPSNAALIQSDAGARELRAAAAARRLSGGDVESGEGGSGRSGAPVPNPWQ